MTRPGILALILRGPSCTLIGLLLYGWGVYELWTLKPATPQTGDLFSGPSYWIGMLFGNGLLVCWQATLAQRNLKGGAR